MGWCGWCLCCRKPRHKRLVDALFPEDPQDATPVAAEQDKLLYFGRSSPEQLDRVGAYLALRLRRSLARERRGHVRVALSITERLVRECDPGRLQLLADSYLDMLHSMLESPHTAMQITATDSFVMFAEREEDSMLYHRQYDFFIHRFASMSLVPTDDSHCHETRRAGLAGLQGVIHKVGQEAGRQLNIWDVDHMNKIVPAFLFNMEPGGSSVQPQFHAELASSAEAGLKQLLFCAGVEHTASVVKPVLQHFDLGNIWTMQREFAAHVFVTLTKTMNPPDRYKVTQGVMQHLDAKAGEACALKQGILAVLSCCVVEATDGAQGPSLLDVFNTLVRHLCTSIESAETPMGDPTQEAEFQEALLAAAGEWSARLPDYHKPDIMNVIKQHLPLGIRGQERQAAFPLSNNDLCLQAVLVRYVRAVAGTYSPSALSLEATFSDTLFPTLTALLRLEGPADAQMDVSTVWQLLLDHHGNQDKIPFNTSWESLDGCGLALGRVTQQFVDRTRSQLYNSLFHHASLLPPSLAHHQALYKLLFLLQLELARSGVRDMTLHLQRLQDHAQSGTGPAQGVPGPTPHTRHMLHAVVAGLLHLVARVSGNEILQEHIQEVIARRQSSAPHLLPEGVFGVESSDGPVGPGEGEGEGEGEVDNELLFHLKPLIGMTPEVKRGFASFRESAKDLSREGSRKDSFSRKESFHQSISLDYEVESPLHPEQITFDSLRDSTESPRTLTHTKESLSSVTPTFSELVNRSSLQESISVLKDFINPNLSSGETSLVSSSRGEARSAYDIELPSLH